MKFILKSSKEIIITYILNYILIFILALIYTLLGYNDLPSFLNTTCIYILLIFYTITIFYLYKKNYKKELQLPIKKYFPLISLGISIAVLLNMIIFIFVSPTTSSTLSIPIAIISSGIIGPIYEEILFRYILYNRLKNKYSTKKSILITTIIFAISHLSLIKMTYAFILGLIINIIYERDKNILSPILIHTSANVIVIFLTEYNTYILLLSILCLALSVLSNTNVKTNKNSCQKK